MPGIFLTGNFIRGITLIIVFAFVLTITWLTTRFIANYQKKTNLKGNIDVIEVRRISGTKAIEIIRIGSDYYAVAVGKDEINLIGRLDENTIKLPEDDPKVKASFSDMINSILNKGSREDNKGKL